MMNAPQTQPWELEAEFFKLRGSFAAFYEIFINADSDALDAVAGNISGDALAGLAETVSDQIERCHKAIHGKEGAK